MAGKKVILICGGHYTPAQAIMDKLLLYNWEIWYVGRKYAQEHEKTPSIEYQLLHKRQDINFICLTTGRINNTSAISTLFSLFQFPFALFKALALVKKIKPSLILSFGGFLGVPVAFASWIAGVPVIIHEQTHKLGIANSITAFVAKAVCISWPQTDTGRHKNKTVLTGIPIRLDVGKTYKKLPLALTKPLLYICGGSQGSHTINENIKPILNKLLQEFAIVHQTGENKIYEDFEYFSRIRNSLTTSQKASYLPLKFVSSEYLGWLYKNTHFAISRTGANTVAEFAQESIPAIFIPLPFATNNEQYENALIYHKHHAGIIIEEHSLNPSILLANIIEMKKNFHSYKISAAALKTKFVRDGVNNLLKIIFQTAHDPK